MAACVVTGVVACIDETSFPELPAEEFTASLVGANEVPSVTTTAGGSAVFAVIQDTILSWRVDVADIDSTILAHIHAGAAGVAGPVIVNLFDASTVNCKQDAGAALQIVSSSVGNPTTITTTAAHGLTVATTPLMRIAGHVGSTPSLDGEHTATVTDTITFTIPVNVTTAGTGGTAQRFTLINVASLRCRVDYTGIVAQAQLRPAGLTHANIQSYGATPRERFDSLISLMRTGEVYVNVHTRTNPGGEVRGQLGPI
jgi:hypothetical protein